MSWNKAAQETFKRNGERFETDLTDEEWALIETLLPPPSRMGRQRKTSARWGLTPDRIRCAPQWACHIVLA